MLSESSDEFIDYCRCSCLNLQCLVNRTSNFIVTDSKFNFRFFFKRKVFGEKVDELLWCFTSNGAVDNFKSNCG